MTHIDACFLPKRNIAVRIASDEECNSFVIQSHIQSFLRPFACIVPSRKILDGLLKAAKTSGVVLLAQDGEQAMLAALSMEDYMACEYWVRDFIALRPPGTKRRNRSATLERRRYLLTLYRMAFPRESTTVGRSSKSLGVEFTQLAPMEAWK